MLHSEPRGSLYAEAFTAIEADLEAFGHGQEAGHNVHDHERAVIYISANGFRESFFVSCS